MTPSTDCIFTRRSFFAEKSSSSFSCREKARTTRTPARFSRVAPLRSSSARCTFLLRGMVSAMISQMNAPMMSVTPRNTSPSFQSTSMEATSAPRTMKGERRNSLKKRFTPFSDWLTSAVMRVMSAGMPALSSSAWERELILANIAERSSVP